MKKSKTVLLTILGTIALTLLLYGCDEKQEVKHCVDENDNVVDEAQCSQIEADASVAEVKDTDGGVIHRGSNNSGGHFIPYRWYYGGGTVYSPGTRVSGGSYAPSVGKSYSPPSTISRGGFGSTGRGVGISAGE